MLIKVTKDTDEVDDVFPQEEEEEGEEEEAHGGFNPPTSSGTGEEGVALSPKSVR